MKTYFYNTRRLTIEVLMASALLVSCEKVDTDPIIVFRDADSKIITGDTLYVPINSTTQTLVEVEYPNSAPEYLRQIDNGKIETLEKRSDYKLKSNGVRTNGNDFEKIIITTQFADSLVHVGSIVKISARLTDMAESVYYKVCQ